MRKARIRSAAATLDAWRKPHNHAPRHAVTSLHFKWQRRRRGSRLKHHYFSEDLIRCNRHVEYVDKRHCSLTSVPDDIMRYARSLEEVLLDANHIHDLPKNFFRLNKLRRLGLSDNEIPRIPPDIQNFENLVELDVSRNDIPDIPDNIKALKSLQVADFSSNPIPKLPPGFTQLKNLTVLGLNDMSLTNLPLDFGSLVNLTSLELRENLLKSLPESVARLSKLERLDIGDNDIEELPSHIGDLPALQELWLDHNQMSHLPPEIGRLKNLMCLDVSENRLEDIPEELAGLINLTDLHLSQNLIETLPPGIGHLHHLTICKLDQNRLLSLHDNIGRCESLQELILTENMLFELPSSIGNLVKLTNLNVDRNRLTHLPQEIGELVSLGVLSLRDNRLTRLPPETGNCRSLHVLDVSGNRLQYLPISITALNLKAVWLSENQAQPMLNFQTEMIEETGEEALTCFLLPQEEYQHDGGVGVSGGVESWMCEDDDMSVDGTTHSLDATRHSVVKFQEDQDFDPSKESNFVRHNTPHPRDLKAKAEKLFGKGGVPAASSSNSVMKHNAVSTEPSSRENMSGNDGAVHSTNATFTIENTAAALHEEQQQQQTGTRLPQQSPPAPQATVVSSYETDSNDSDEGSSSSSDDSSGGERERRVVFAEQAAERGHDHSEEDGDDEDERREVRPSRLHRRDTPHHLKNKRISTANKTADLEKVASIIAQPGKSDSSIHQELQQQLSAGSGVAALSPPHVPHNHVGRINETVVCVAGRINETVVCVAGRINETVVCVAGSGAEMRQLSVKVERTTGGLGLSIAGGHGSTPYKGSDQGIFISRVAEGGPAYAAGLRVGDKVLSVNGVEVEAVDHYDAVNIMREAGAQLHLVVLRELPATEPTQVGEEVRGLVAPGLHNHLAPATSVLTSTPLTGVASVTNTSIASSGSGGGVPLTPVAGIAAAASHPAVASSSYTPGAAGVPLSPPHAGVSSTPVPAARGAAAVEVVSPALRLQQPALNGVPATDAEDLQVVRETICTTLVRNHEGLGFSIAGGGHAMAEQQPLFIKSISEGGVAAKDGKLRVGDRLISINGVDLDGARHDQAVSLLTGLDRFVRLVAQRESLVTADVAKAMNASAKGGYSGLYNSNSYMANRPSYTGYRRAQPTSRLVSPNSSSSLNTTPNISGTSVSNVSAHDLSSDRLSAPVADAPLVNSYNGNAALLNNGILDNTPNDTNNNSRARSTGSSIQDSTTQVSDGEVVARTRPLTNEEFEAMIPQHFLKGQAAPQSNGLVESGGIHVAMQHPTVPHKPMLPAAPSQLGQVTEVLTKTTLTETTVTRLTDNRLAQVPLIIEDVILEKDGGPMGLSIIGGSDHFCMPFGSSAEDPGIYISKITAGGSAHRTRQLRMGDRILAVDDVDMSGATHQEAVLALLTPPKQIRLTVRHDPQPAGLMEVVIKKFPGERLGMNIKGGVGGTPGNPFNKSDEGIFISKINASGAANRDGRLRVGQRILEFNESSLLGCTHDEAVTTMRSAGTTIRLVVCDGYDHQLAQQLKAEGRLANDSRSASQSVCSLDKHELEEHASPQQVMEVVRAAEQLAAEAADESCPVHASKPDAKTTTVVLGQQQQLQPPAPDKSPVISPHRMTLKEKMKFFEDGMNEKQPKEKKTFSYLSADEVTRMKEYEERQMSARDQLPELSDDEEKADDEELVDELALQLGGSQLSAAQLAAVEPPHVAPVQPQPAQRMSVPRIRTVNAEKRAQNLNAFAEVEGLENEEDEMDLSPADRRKREAEKRAAWRKERLKSLENDAVEAQHVIDQIAELSNASMDSGPDELHP
ncbi:PDZ domain [Trinorchestia longiramus]|nr:PDZ domain [Trinorchestia longiramus]